MALYDHHLKAYNVFLEEFVNLSNSCLHTENVNELYKFHYSVKIEYFTKILPAYNVQNFSIILSRM